MGDVLSLLGEDDPRIVTHLINNIYETGEWPKVFTEVAVTALKNERLQNAAAVAL
jgi:hypothetical protein